MSDSPPQAGPLAFGDFFEHLRRQGFIIGIGDYLRLQQLLNQVSSDCAPSDLKTLLCPLLATNQIQQAQFHAAFDTYFDLFQPFVVERPNRISEVDLVVRSKESTAKLKSTISRKWSYVAWALGLILLIVLALIIKTITGSQDQGSHSGATPVEPGVAIQPTTAPGPEPPVITGESEGQPNASPVAIPPSSPEVKRAFYQRYKEGIYLGGAIIALLFGVLFYLWRQSNRSKMVLQKQRGKKPPYVWPIRVPGSTPRLYDSEPFYEAARLLRHRQVDEFHRLDVNATIAATIEALGYPSFRYKPDSKPPEYLVLIDRASFRDHQAQLFNELAKLLEQEAIFILRYFYSGDPRICTNETGEPIHLLELQRKYAGHRLLIFGNGEKIIDPITGKLAAWSTVFADWQDRAVLTPQPPAQWTLREVTLASQFILLPATMDGLLALVSHFESSATNDLRRWRRSHAEAPLPPLDQPGSIEALRRHLGEDSFQWLCACAVYPELHWDLTLYLGLLPCMEANLVRQDNLLRLIRLPWFRMGAIPDDLRWRLIQELDPEKERVVRAAIIEAMEKNPPPQETFAADAYQLDLVAQRWLSLRDRKRRRELLRAMKASPKSQRSRDYTLLRSLESARVSPLDFILPQRLRKLFYQNRISAFNLLSGARALPRLVLGPRGLLLLPILASLVVLIIYKDAYSPGPLSSPHVNKFSTEALAKRNIADHQNANSCSNCHSVTEGMQGKCVECHRTQPTPNISAFKPTIYDAHDIEGMACSSCHTEHLGADIQAGLVIYELCANCHNGKYKIKAPQNITKVGPLLPVPHGGTVGYPVVNGKWEWKLTAEQIKQRGLPEEWASYESNDQFHAVHSLGRMVNRTTCGDCHTRGGVDQDAKSAWNTSPRETCATCHGVTYTAAGVQIGQVNCNSCHPQHGQSSDLAKVVDATANSDQNLKNYINRLSAGAKPDEQIRLATARIFSGTGTLEALRQNKGSINRGFFANIGALPWYVWIAIVSGLSSGGLALLMLGTKPRVYATGMEATGDVHKAALPARLVHALGILLTMILTGLTIISISRYGMGEPLLSFLNMRWTTGLLGLTGIMGAMTYQLARRRYAERIGYWRPVHSYMGVIAGIMILLHGGSDSGGAFTTVLMWSFDGVIITGLIGVFCHAAALRLPTTSTGEPLAIDDLNARRAELQKELAEIANYSAPLRDLLKNRVIPRFFSFSYLLRQYLKLESRDAMLESSREEFKNIAAALANDDERRKLYQAVAAAAMLRRTDALVYLYRGLGLWRVPHNVFTSVTLALLIVHVIQVIYYASR